MLSYDVVPKLLVVLPFHFNLFWQSLNVTVPAPLFFSKCFRTNDELADDSSIAKTGFYIDLRLFCACASGTNNSNNETKFEHRSTNTFIRIFDLFVSPLTETLCGNKKEICSISSRSRVLAHRPCPKPEMFCPSVLQLFYGCSKVLMTNHGMSFFLFLFSCFSNRLKIRAQLH